MTEKTLSKHRLKTLLPISNESNYSQFWLGTWSMGGEHFGPFSIKQAEKTLSDAYFAGVRHIDTASFYAHGKSDQLLSKFLNSIDRKTMFISSKAGLHWNKNEVRHQADRKQIIETLKKSLDTLKTDYIDLFSLHWPDPNTKLEESIETLKELQQEGLIRHYGVCNLSKQELKAYVDPLTPQQVHFNPLYKKGFFSLSKSSPTIVYSPLEQGLLSSGICGAGAITLGKKDIRLRNPLFKSKEALSWRDKFNTLCLDQILPKEVIILLWIYSFTEVDSIISGARTEAQFEVTFSVFKWCNILKLDWNNRTSWKQKLVIIFGIDLYNHLYGPAPT
jgi:aryl-alcohol dehydrogenase-like predicted oxidoreductase